MSLQYKKGKCKGDCGCTDILIVNKTKGLCMTCNSARLAVFKVPKEKPKKPVKIYQLKQTRPKQVSSKKKESNITLAEVYEQIAQTREHVCTGCGTTKHLSHSHIIRRGKREDLECDPNNITYHCLSIGKEGCHDRHESCDYFKMSTLLDFQKNMEYIESIDIQHYNYLLNQFEEQQRAHHNKLLENRE